MIFHCFGLYEVENDRKVNVLSYDHFFSDATKKTARRADDLKENISLVLEPLDTPKVIHRDA